MTVASAELYYVGDLDAFARQMMNDIGVVPVESEVRGCSSHRRQALDHFVRKDGACRIAVFGNAPHGFDRCILGHEFLELVHIRPIFPERYLDHADAIIFTDFEMPIVTWNRTQKRNFSLF